MRPKNGASEEVRTLDIYLGKVVLYQLSYARIHTMSVAQVRFVKFYFTKKFDCCFLGILTAIA